MKAATEEAKVEAYAEAEAGGGVLTVAQVALFAAVDTASGTMAADVDVPESVPEDGIVSEVIVADVEAEVGEGLGDDDHEVEWNDDSILDASAYGFKVGLVTFIAIIAGIVVLL